MRYIVIGKSAVLATRDIERIAEGQATNIIVSGVPDGASLTFIGKDERQFTYEVISQAATVDFSSFDKGRFGVNVLWYTYEEGDSIEHEAHGNPFEISEDEEGLFVIPAPLGSASDIEKIWQAITDTLDELLPLADHIRNGADVV